MPVDPHRTQLRYSIQNMSLFEHLADLPAHSSNGQARAHALASVEVDTPATSLVGYSSAGKLLVIGSEASVAQVYLLAEKAADALHYLILKNDRQPDDAASASAMVPRAAFRASECAISGHLGSFSVVVTKEDKTFDLGEVAGIDSRKFDLIFDLSAARVMPAAVSPFGYKWLAPEQAGDERVAVEMAELAELTGNFEKPKYFNYNPDICAHADSGITACTRCIDACATDAIISIGTQVEANPHLCQGLGACAAACPTGAMTYAYPPPSAMMETLRQVLKTYRDAGGQDAVIIFFDTENGKDRIRRHLSTMPENFLPMEVEEVGCIGLDICLALLAYGASGAKILCAHRVEAMIQELRDQTALLDALLSGMGYTAGAVEIVVPDGDEAGDDQWLHCNHVNSPAFAPATFMPSGIKRTDMRIALEHLHAQSPLKPAAIALPAHAPFGEIHVNQDTCTLCMGCVSVCPAAALESGGDVPKLSFIENNCVQCGLCESACPENSIARSQRYVFETDPRMRARTLNEDAPFHCRMCGKPFASSVMLNRMKERLKDHHMFQSADAIMRLEMCEDCRVKDMFAAEGGFPRQWL